jgi:hypothetical protein
MVYGAGILISISGWVAVERSWITAPGAHSRLVEGVANAPRLGASRVPEVEMQRLGSRVPKRATADPFESDPWVHAQTEDARRNAPRPPPPPPQAPPLPYAFLGRLIDENHTTVFLTSGDRNYAVRTGDIVDGAYRVEEVSERTVTFTYLPLDSGQVLATGGPALAVSIGAQPGFDAATGILAPPTESVGASAESARLVWRAPSYAPIGGDFTIEVGLPSGPQPRSGRVELAYDARVLAILGGAAPAPARATDSANARRASLEIIGPGFPGVPPTPSEVRFKVVAADPTRTEIGIENLTAVAGGSPLVVGNPAVHPLAIVPTEGIRDESN